MRIRKGQFPDALQRYDLAIAYRIYPKVAKPALGLPFSDDKLRMSEVCLRSFKESLGDLRVKIWVLLDGCSPEYQDLFRKYFEADDLVLIPTDSVGNQATFSRQIDILLAQQASDLVYFAEDDYFYLPGQFPRMVEFMRLHEDADFASPFDHLDCYTLDIHRFPKSLRVSANHHWRTAASTCLTFLTRQETLRKCEPVFRTFCRRNDDCSLWLSLTKHSLCSPARFVRYLFGQRMLARIVAKSWIYCWQQILFGKRRRLWIPVPGIATHMDSHALSPTIDWAALMKAQGEFPEGVETTDAANSPVKTWT